MKKPDNPLDFLPEAMVDEMLQGHSDMVRTVAGRLEEVVRVKKFVRSKLKEIGKLKKVNDYVGQRSYPTTVGVDGTYALIRQVSLDTVGVAAVAVEGLIPPKEMRLWEKPHHKVRVFPVEHNENTSPVLSALMFSYELELATRAPHRVVFLDGSLTTYLIKIGQGLNHVDKAPSLIKDEFLPRAYETLENLLKVVESSRVDISYVGCPKYTSRNEVLKMLGERYPTSPIPNEIDDKGVLSLALEAGEVIEPVKLTRQTDRWHLTLGKDREKDERFTSLRKRIITALNELYVMYFKPHENQPALRLEIGKNIATNKKRIGVVLEAVWDQTGIPGVFEPYPLYIADQFVKNAYSALFELKDATLPELNRSLEISPDVILAFHDYRTEAGYE
jgi:hypothetical protein